MTAGVVLMISHSSCNHWSVPSSIPGSPSLSDETYAVALSLRFYKPELLLVEPSGAPGHKTTKPPPLAQYWLLTRNSQKSIFLVCCKTFSLLNPKEI